MATKIFIPNGSQTNIVGSDLIITAPPGWDYIGFDEHGNYAAVGGGTKVSCTCNTTGTCLPSVFDDGDETTGSCSGTCTDCTMKQSSSDGGTKFTTGGYVDMNGNVDFLPSGASLPGLFSAMGENSIIMNALSAFLQNVFQGSEVPELTIINGTILPPEGCEIVVLNVFGRAGIFPIPVNLAPAGSTTGSDAKCSCTDGTCTPEKTTIPFKGTLIQCKGECDGTCTLSLTANTVEVNSTISYQF